MIAARALEPAGMPLLEYELFRRLIRDAFGLDYPPNKRELLRTRLDARLRANGLRRYGEYYRLLSFESPADAEWRLFAEAITNNETYFFREGRQLAALAQILPEIARRSRGPGACPSAGCSSGEEAYGLAMALANRLGRSARFEVCGLDLSEAKLAEARLGRYQRKSFHADEAAPLGIDASDYLSRETDGSFTVRPFLRERVTFHRGNLAKAAHGERSRRVRRRLLPCATVLIYARKRSPWRASSRRFATLVRGAGTCSWGTRTPSTGRPLPLLADPHRRPVRLRPPAMTIRVLVVDDSSFIRRAVTRMLAEDATISIVGQAAHGSEAIELVHSLAPDVITLDLEMPGGRRARARCGASWRSGPPP